MDFGFSEICQNPAYCFFCFFLGWEMRKARGANRLIVKSKSKFFPFLLGGLVTLAVLVSMAFAFTRFVSYRIHNNPSTAMLSDKWSEYDYQGVYDTAGVLLEKKTFNNTALTYRGYSAFYLAVASTSSYLAQEYIDEAIRALRVAMLYAKDKTLPQIHYILGKSYFYKDSISSYHYYADMVVHYLTLAKKEGYKADDISEYLGLGYAQLGMTLESIAAFSEALLVRESDALLLSIAEQYSKAGQDSAAKQYLFQIIQRSQDDSLIIKSRTLLGNILIAEKDYEGAQKEFEALISKNENIADAHYGLGLVYEGRGDLAKARAEWRRTLRIQVNHADALSKIQHYR